MSEPELQLVSQSEDYITRMFAQMPVSLLESVNETLAFGSGELVDILDDESYRYIQTLGLKTIARGGCSRQFLIACLSFLILYKKEVPGSYYRNFPALLESDDEEIRSLVYRLIAQKKVVLNENNFVINFQKEFALLERKGQNMALENALEAVRELRLVSLRLLVKRISDYCKDQIAEIILALQELNPPDVVAALTARKTALELISQKASY